MSTFARFSEQPEAARLLDAALREGPAHAYLFHGPAGVGKRETARTFARALLGTSRDFHPDLYELDALGEMIRIDAIRELRRDLHLRPFEADRRVYLVHRAHLLNEDAADALLKDLEEPPSYAVIVLVADDLGPLPETIRSRCQLVPFRRLSERAIRELVDARAPALDEEARAALARVSAGRLDRLERLLDPDSAKRREALLEQARAVYRSPSFDASAAAEAVLANAQAVSARARDLEEARIKDLELPAREAEQRVRRAARGAEREELLAELEELGAWYRDLVAVAVGADDAAIHLDKLRELREDATRERLVGAERAAEAVRETWRELEELNLVPQLALEALFVRVGRELAPR
ncbi:MAG TPA: DNA polymerase III subunit [Gaiellaceae bacterium]|nr:DNA polymerase III subunit [Gaiellaceae bacterium]